MLHPHEYRTTTRNLLHLGGTITYTPPTSPSASTDPPPPRSPKRSPCSPTNSTPTHPTSPATPGSSLYQVGWLIKLCGFGVAG
jgi:hypothetical protein